MQQGKSNKVEKSFPTLGIQSTNSQPMTEHLFVKSVQAVRLVVCTMGGKNCGMTSSMFRKKKNPAFSLSTVITRINVFASDT